MANNKLELQIEVDASGAVKGLQFVQGKAAETADKVSKSFGNTSFDSFAESVKRGIEDPLGAAANAAKGMLSALGPVGTGLAVAGAAFGAFAAAGFEAAKTLGEYGDALEDTATRMGLTVKETAQFSFAMKYAGGSIESLEASMRMLSQGLNESTEDGKKAKEGLKALGIEARDSSGQLRPMSQIFVELSQKLGGIEDIAKRNTIAIQVLGRAGLQVLPDLLELADGVKRANEVGIKGPSPDELRKWKDYHHQVVEFETEWAKLKRDTMQPIAATVLATWKWIGEFRDAGTFGRDEKGNLRTNPNTGLIPKSPNSGLAYGRMGFYEYDVNGALQQMQGNLYPGTPGAALAAGQAQSANIRAASKAQVDAVLQRWGMTKEGLDAALSEARKNEAAALTKLKDGDASAIGDFQKAQGEVSRIEAKLKSIADAQKAAESITSLIQKYSETAQSAVTKLTLQLDADLKKVNPADRMRLETAAYGAIIRTMQQEYAKSADAAAKAGMEMATALEKADESIRETMAKAGGFGKVESNPLSPVLNIPSPTNIGSPGASADQRVQSLSAAEQAQERIVQLLAGPGGEVAAIGQISAMRASLAAQERSIAEEKAASITDEVERSKALYDAKFSYEEKLAQVQRDNAIQLLELRKKQEDDYVNAVKGGFQALISGGRSGLGSFIGSQAMGLGTTVLGNVTRMGYEKLQSSNSIPGFSSNSLFGSLLAGTPFVKAGDVQMTAAQMQLRAATMFSGAMGMPVTGVPFGGLMGALPSMFPGGTFGGGMSRTNPFIWSYQARGTNDIVGDNGLAIPGTGTGTSPALNGMFVKGPQMPMSGLMKGAYYGGAIAAGAIGTYEGAKMGGARGGLTIASSVLGTAAAIDPEPISKGILAVAALAAGLSTMLFGDPKKKYAEREQRMLDSARYEAPESTNYTFDQSGKAYDYDYRGNMRTYVTQNVTIQAMDAQSFQQFATRNGDVFAETIRKQIPNHGGLRMGIQAAVNP